MRRRRWADWTVVALASLAIAGAVVATSLIDSYNPSASSRPAPAVPSVGDGCATINAPPPARFNSDLNNRSSCLTVSLGTAANLSVAWASYTGAVLVEGEWGCYASIDCPIWIGQTPFYGTTSTAGSFELQVGSLGSQWAGIPTLYVTVWASPPTNASADLPVGADVGVLGFLA